MQPIIELFAQMVELAFPVAFVFAMGGKIVHMFMSAAFGGEIRI